MTADMTLQRIIGLIAVALAALALSGCGVRGGLERPAPLWGDADGAQREAAPDEDEDEDDVEDDDFLDPDDWRAPG
ncbi:MAG: LPS translocon maturation chaperone LptM [Oceanicaulis sp.]